MAEPLVEAAPWIALACALLAAAAVAWTGWGAWRRWRELRVVQQAAVALVDVHAERLELAIGEASRATGDLADGGERLAATLAELRADVTHLRWLATRVGDERERLVREVVDALLPTDRRGAADDG